MLVRLIPFLLLLVCFHSWSASLPTKSSVSEETKLLEVGRAKFSVMFWDIYDSRLYTTTGKYPVEQDNENVAFEITYLKDIDREDLITRTVEQWEHIGLNQDEFAHYVPLLESIWPNIKAGDSLRLLIEGSRSHFYFNQEHIGSIESTDFGQKFIDIWLSSNTSQPKLRAQLLGHKKS